MKTTEQTLNALQAKAQAGFGERVRMPSIRQIAALLTAHAIPHTVTTRTNIVEYRSKGRTYVNSRRRGKTGLVLTVGDIELDTSSSYYSRNTWLYAREIVALIQNGRS